MNKKSVRLLAFAAVCSLCVAAWLAVAAAWAFFEPTVAAWTVLVTIAAIATEAVFWVGGVLLGWTAFANRARIWRAVTGRGAA